MVVEIFLFLSKSVFSDTGGLPYTTYTNRVLKGFIALQCILQTEDVSAEPGHQKAHM